MLKVIHDFPLWLPQTQTWMYSQVKQLQLLGVEARVVCERTENLDQFAVANIHSLENEPIFKQIRHKALRKLGIRRQINYLAEVGRKTDAQIIHSHFGPTAWNSLQSVRKLKTRHIVTFYGYDVNQVPVQEPVWRERYTELFEEIDLVLCEGTNMASSLMKLGCPEHKISVQHLGVDVDGIHFQPRHWHSGEPLRVLMAASFREKKGMPYGIEALALVGNNIPIQLTIIGDAGNTPEQQLEKNRIYSALEKSGLREHTRLLGYQSHETLISEAYDHHLFIQPSVTAQDGDTEGGAPVAIIEMLATGMPVVATRHCDIPEVMGPAFSHLLAPERDIKKLAECVQTLLEAPDDWHGLAKSGRKHIEQNYQLRRQTERLITHYRELL